MIIGLSGYARTGKDTVAEILVSKYGYRRIAFADKIKEALITLNPIVVPEIGLHLAEYVNDFSWEVAKNTPEVRRLLQVMGTEVGRNLLSQDIWIEAALENVRAGEKIVLTDVRFPDEADAVKWLFGEVWRIERNGVKATNFHKSESALDEWIFDRIIDNSGTLEDLEESVDVIMEPLQKEAKNDTI